MAMQPFVWQGNTGDRVSPGQVRSYRDLASSLAGQRQKTPENPWQGLQALASAWSERQWREEADRAETEGQGEYNELLSALMASGDPTEADLMGAMAHPWASDAGRSLSSAMLQRDWSQADQQAGWAREDARYAEGEALRNAQLEAALLGNQVTEAELGAIDNPPPPDPLEINGQLIDPTTYSVLGDYRDAAPVDPRPMTMEERDVWGIPSDDPNPYFLNENGEPELVGGRPLVENNLGGDNDIGPIPSGMMVERDAAGNVIGMVPIPGGPAAAEMDAAQGQTEMGASNSASQAANTLQNINAVRELMENATGPTTGTNSIPFSWHSGTDAGRVRSYVSTLQSGVALGAMQRLKEASSTGATGFGALSAPELNILISEMGALNPDTTEPEIFLQTLDRIEANARLVVDDIRRNVSPERIQELGLQPFLEAFGEPPEDGGEGGVPAGVEPEIWEFMTPEERALWN